MLRICMSLNLMQCRNNNLTTRLVVDEHQSLCHVEPSTGSRESYVFRAGAVFNIGLRIGVGA